MTEQATTTEIVTIDALRTAALAELTPIADGIAALKNKFDNVAFDVRTTKGMDEATAARLEIRTPRYKVPHIVKARKADLKQIGKDVETEGDRIVAELLAIEMPIDEQIKAEETRKAEEKRQREEQARMEAEAEARRIAVHQANVEEIRSHAAHAANLGSTVLQQRIDGVSQIDVSAEAFEEYATAAARAKEEALANLSALHTAAIKHEADMAELAELRAIKAKREAEEVERKAVAEREEAERAAQEATRVAVERAKSAPVPFEQQIADADEATAPAQPRALNIPVVRSPKPALVAPRLSSLPAREAVVQADIVLEDEPAAPVAPATPSAAEIIAAVAGHFNVTTDVATEWIVNLQMDL